MSSGAPIHCLQNTCSSSAPSLAPPSAAILDLLSLHTCRQGSGPRQPPRQAFAFSFSWLLGSITIRSSVNKFYFPTVTCLGHLYLVSDCIPRCFSRQPFSTGSLSESVDLKSAPVCPLQENPEPPPSPLQPAPATLLAALCSLTIPCWAVCTLLFAASSWVTFKRQPRGHPSGQLSCPALF